MRKAILASTVALTAVLALSGEAQAFPYSDNLQIVVFDKLFTFNSCSLEVNNNPQASCGAFSITPRIEAIGSQTGYGFDITGLLAATGGSPASPNASDLSIDYSVQICGTTINSVTANCGAVANQFDYNPAITGGHITDAHLRLVGSPGTTGNVSGDELFTDADGNADGDGLHVALPGSAVADTNLPEPTQFLDVSKDIGVLCQSSDCFANVSIITQLFTQDTQGHHQGFPEPASLALMGTGLAGLGGYLRRRAKKA